MLGLAQLEWEIDLLEYYANIYDSKGFKVVGESMLSFSLQREIRKQP